MTLKYLEFTDLDRADYPRELYSVYWELRIDTDSLRWGARLWSYDRQRTDDNYMDEAVGKAADSEDSALVFMRAWVLSRIEKYRRP